MRFIRYLLVHPFDGFYQLKFERMGSGKLGALFLVLLYISAVLKQNLSGYLFNQSFGEPVNLLLIAGTVILPYVLWCVSSWCLTVLFSGEGTMGQILMAVSYCTVPLTVANVLCTVLSNVLVNDEAVFVTVIESASYLLFAFLLLAAMLEIHQYSFMKTLVTSAFTLLGMLIMVFVAMLAVELIQQMLVFVESVYKEISYRSM